MNGPALPGIRGPAILVRAIRVIRATGPAAGRTAGRIAGRGQNSRQMT